ncbi:MAG: nitroreductase family protein, partial [Dehalococcoidia bacterium]|nr:nitroreductase family protein [Dehalococcoidia bacterium]
MLDDALAGRRSVRQFSARPVERALVDEVIAAACLAPAPHHSRPWRFVIL